MEPSSQVFPHRPTKPFRASFSHSGLGLTSESAIEDGAQTSIGGDELGGDTSEILDRITHDGCFVLAVLCWISLPVYTLTRIFSVKYIESVESVFEIIAEPNRRAILSLLVSSQQSVGEIERQLRMPQPTVSKHLRVLREAGFVESTVDAQRRLYRLKPEPFRAVDAWLAQFRRFWSAHVDALERHLDRMDASKATKRKIRRRRRGPSRERDKGETK